MYVDPTNYDHPEDAVQEFASELDPKNVFLERLIGGGKYTHNDNSMNDVNVHTLIHLYKDGKLKKDNRSDQVKSGQAGKHKYANQKLSQRF